MGFIGTAITATLIGSGVLLLAGEIRLAALRKAFEGSSKLSYFEAVVAEHFGLSEVRS